MILILNVVNLIFTTSKVRCLPANGIVGHWHTDNVGFAVTDRHGFCDGVLTRHRVRIGHDVVTGHILGVGHGMELVQVCRLDTMFGK